MAEAKTSSVKSMVLPPLVLALICAVCCAFLALANMVTRDKIAAAEADAIQTSLKQLPDAGTFEEVTDFQPENKLLGLFFGIGKVGMEFSGSEQIIIQNFAVVL